MPMIAVVAHDALLALRRLTTSRSDDVIVKRRSAPDQSSMVARGETPQKRQAAYGSKNAIAEGDGERHIPTRGGERSALTKAGHGPMFVVDDNPPTAHSECVCDRCHQPLYPGEPMAVAGCKARAPRGCGHICRPEDDCPIPMGSALHVGRAVLRRNGGL